MSEVWCSPKKVLILFFSDSDEKTLSVSRRIMRVYVVSFLSGPIREIIPAVVLENVFSDAPVKNSTMSAMEAFDIARPKLMMPPMWDAS